LLSASQNRRSCVAREAPGARYVREGEREHISPAWGRVQHCPRALTHDTVHSFNPRGRCALPAIPQREPWPAARRPSVCSASAIGDVPVRAALTSYMDGVTSGFFGLHDLERGPPTPAGGRLPGRAPSALAAIWQVGASHGQRIRRQHTGGNR